MKSENNIPSVPLDGSIAVCIRNHQGFVQFQSELCQKICGKQESTRCVEGCQQLFQFDDSVPCRHLGMQFYPHTDLRGCLSDVLIINNEAHLTSVLYPLETKLKKEMDYLGDKGLSKREYQVAVLAAKGLSNREILKQLCISKATLKTHLNVIYKKIPELKSSGFRRFPN